MKIPTVRPRNHPTGLRIGGLAVVDTCRTARPRTVVIVDATPLNGSGKIAKPMPRKLITTQVGSESRDCVGRSI